LLSSAAVFSKLATITRTLNVDTTKLFAGLLAILTSGCLGHSERTAGMRSALDARRPDAALHALNQVMRTHRPGGDRAVLQLDRATVLQALGRFAESARDYESADKGVDFASLSRNAVDTVADVTVSSSITRYEAPTHERLLINPLNALNYLELGDLDGACVEARRHTVFSTYLADRGTAPDLVWGFGSAIAGFAFEKAGKQQVANQYYADAMTSGIPMTPWHRDETPKGDQGELLVVVGDGRVPHLVSVQHLGGRDMVTYPGLAPYQRPMGRPKLRIGNRDHLLVPTLDVGDEVVRAYRAIEPELIAKAIARSATRGAVGDASEAVADRIKDKNAKAMVAVAGLFARIALLGADTADTRSWETLPARLSVLRVPLDPGTHDIVLSSRGVHRHVKITMLPRGWATVTLFALH
jgi:uncharacterized protein